jgi:hypothetical protein
MGLGVIAFPAQSLPVRGNGPLDPFDGAVFTVRLIPEGRFAPVVAMQGGTPKGFANFEADGEGRLTRLRWLAEDQVFLWQKTGGPPHG